MPHLHTSTAQWCTMSPTLAADWHPLSTVSLLTFHYQYPVHQFWTLQLPRWLPDDEQPFTEHAIPLLGPMVHTSMIGSAHHLHIFSVLPVLDSLVGPLDLWWTLHVPAQHWQPPTQQHSVTPQKTQRLCSLQDNLLSPLLDPPDPHSPSNFLFCTTKYFLLPNLLVFLLSVSATVPCSLLLSAPLTNGPV